MEEQCHSLLPLLSLSSLWGNILIMSYVINATVCHRWRCMLSSLLFVINVIKVINAKSIKGQHQRVRCNFQRNEI